MCSSDLAAKAAGGSVKGYAGGGSVTSREFKEYAVDNVPSQMLPLVQRNAQARGDMDTYQLAMEQMAQDAALRRGVSSALPPGVDVVRAAGGGILAFAGKGSQQVSDEGNDDNWVQTPGGLNVLGEDLDDSTLAAMANDGSAGNPQMQQVMGRRLLDVIGRVESDTGYTPMSAEERTEIGRAHV